MPGCFFAKLYMKGTHHSQGFTPPTVKPSSVMLQPRRPSWYTILLLTTIILVYHLGTHKHFLHTVKIKPLLPTLPLGSYRDSHTDTHTNIPHNIAAWRFLLQPQGCALPKKADVVCKPAEELSVAVENVSITPSCWMPSHAPRSFFHIK